MKYIVSLVVLFSTLFCNTLCAVEKYPLLPAPVSNNAVTMVSNQTGDYILSFMGLGKNKDYSAVHNKVYALKLGDKVWQAKNPVPSSLRLKGRLASIAVAVKDQAYIFGGYTVAKDHSEISSPDNFRYDVAKDSYYPISAMPVAVDDAIALVYQNRYIYLISGWHNDGNVNLVQVYDTKLNSWQQASPLPGNAVFGHAGGIVGDKILLCDGVRVQVHQNKRRSFSMENACYLGTIQENTPYKIDWHKVKHPTGKGRYRMAATGYQGDIWFYGGSENPYNYNGIGYNKEPSLPTKEIWRFNLAKKRWSVSQANTSSMDHRGLITYKDQLLVVGGMGKEQKVLNMIQVVHQ
ncbi:Kelch repeat-containing protein [Agarilytica rhodophyticola]|uniref:Kelch repeat-containing protein n=1 Tax=Agarilytica rhodophyticola TaxID=1737490 RepID=UPI001C1F40DA|nr:hypothetical protein [Agarilytica rhodophyticola]